jgi:hypothetical protein
VHFQGDNGVATLARQQKETTILDATKLDSFSTSHQNATFSIVSFNIIFANTNNAYRRRRKQKKARNDLYVK